MWFFIERLAMPLPKSAKRVLCGALCTMALCMLPTLVSCVPGIGGVLTVIVLLAGYCYGCMRLSMWFLFDRRAKKLEQLRDKAIDDQWHEFANLMHSSEYMDADTLRLKIWKLLDNDLNTRLDCLKSKLEIGDDDLEDIEEKDEDDENAD
jgi:hypothetical protein